MQSKKGPPRTFEALALHLVCACAYQMSSSIFFEDSQFYVLIFNSIPQLALSRCLWPVSPKFGSRQERSFFQQYNLSIISLLDVPFDHSLITLKIAVNKVTNLELILFSEGHTTVSFSQPLLNSLRHKIILMVSLCDGYSSEESIWAPLPLTLMENYLQPIYTAMVFNPLVLDHMQEEALLGECL